MAAEVYKWVMRRLKEKKAESWLKTIFGGLSRPCVTSRAWANARHSPCLRCK